MLFTILVNTLVCYWKCNFLTSPLLSVCWSVCLSLFANIRSYTSIGSLVLLSVNSWLTHLDAWGALHLLQLKLGGSGRRDQGIQS